MNKEVIYEYLENMYSRFYGLNIGYEVEMFNIFMDITTGFLGQEHESFFTNSQRLQSIKNNVEKGTKRGFERNDAYYTLVLLEEFIATFRISLEQKAFVTSMMNLVAYKICQVQPKYKELLKDAKDYTSSIKQRIAGV